MSQSIVIDIFVVKECMDPIIVMQVVKATVSRASSLELGKTRAGSPTELSLLVLVKANF